MGGPIRRDHPALLKGGSSLGIGRPGALPGAVTASAPGPAPGGSPFMPYDGRMPSQPITRPQAAEDEALARDRANAQKLAEFVGGYVSHNLETGDFHVVMPYTRGALDDLARGRPVCRGPR